MKYLLKFNEQQINEGEINWEKEKSWKIKDEFPITVFVEKSWTGKYYVIKAPTMKMSYETFQNLDFNHKVDISTYDYENGEATWTSYKLEHIKEWAEKYKDKIIVDYSKNLN